MKIRMNCICYWVAISLVTTLFGCASSGTQITSSTASQLQEGKTTEAEILSVLGKPTAVVIAGGQKTLTYSGAQCQTKATTFIPLVGIFAGGMDCQSSAVVIVIGPSGIAQKVVYSEHVLGSKNGPTPTTQSVIPPSIK